MKRTGIIVILFLLTFVAYSQVAAKSISVNQFVEHPALDAVLKGIQDGLKEAGEDVTFNVHIAQANMATATTIAQQMVGEQPDLMIAIATPSAQACAQALKKAPAKMKRPFLFTAVTDPVSAGLVSNLEKPGGMTTGVSDMLPLKENVEMILSFKPGIKKLGFLYNAGEANSKVLVPKIKALGEELGFVVVEATAAKTADVPQAAKSLVGKVDAVFIPTDNTIVSNLESVIKVGVDNKLPIFAADVDSVTRGAAAAIGFDYYQHGRQTAKMAQRILNGDKAGDTPVEFQENLELHINKIFAKKMGVIPPEELVKKAQKIHE